MESSHRRIVGLIVVLVMVNGLFVVLPRARYRAIVVHHSAGDHGDHRSIRRAHLARGWFETAYHLVLSNGSTDVPFGHLYPTWRYRLGLWSVATRSPRHNVGALHLCVVGNFDPAAPGPRLQAALGHAIRRLQARHAIPDERILLHRDCSATVCPGREITRERLVAWARASREAPAAIREQHRRAVGGPWSLGRLAIWSGVHLLLLALWLRTRWLQTRRLRTRTEGSAGLCHDGEDTPE